MAILSLSAPLNSINPRFLNLSMNTLTLERLAPIMSASTSAVVPTSSLLVSLGSKWYVSAFANDQKTYGAIGGAIGALLWLYVSGLALLMGAEMNAVIEHASPMGKDPGETMAGGGTG
jgi:uncharacterized BrkB/YihY/UPF0761 family membrane protein